ncbi:MAG: hypothetical protein NTY35_13785 [Planctomycetota bacterium]|nr:hypothetical protein [Planctomycetota bacterium]
MSFHRTASRRAARFPLQGGFAALVFLAASANAQVDHTVGVAPVADPVLATLPGGRAFELPGLGDDFVFATGGQFVELPSGEARLIGVLERMSDPRKRFLANLALKDFVGPLSPNFPPVGAPLLELRPQAYTPNGGVVNPSQWHYWTRVEGSFTGLGDYRGAKLSIAERGPAQCGDGANGRNAAMGVTGLVRATTVAQPTLGPALPATIDATANLDLARKSVAHAENAVSDAAVTDHLSGHAFYLDTLGADWRFVAGGEFEETADGSARLTGVIARQGTPNEQFFVDLDLSTRTNPGEVGYAPAGSPKLELKDAVYAANGGPVDPNHWYYYETFGGTLTGLRGLTGVRYSVSRMGPALQVGVGANGKNLAWGGSGWLNLALLAAPANTNYPQALVGDVNLDLGGDESLCASKADAQSGIGSNGGHALHLPAIGTDFVFQPGGQFTELANGTAVLTGLVARTSDASQRFLVSATFTGRLDPADFGYPPPMSPKTELVASAYVQNGGGPVDTNTWHYYTQTNGTLIGQGAFLGANVQYVGFMAAFQVGLGASGKNLNYGGSGWLSLTTQSQPQNSAPFPATFHGDFNLDFNDECSNCATRAGVDTSATYTPGGHALYLPGIWPNFQLAPGASFQEFDDGHARLVGTAFPPRRPMARFAVDLVFTARLDLGETGFAPSGSPHLELYPSQYAANGGPIDPQTWHYYQATDGFLVGEGVLAGALYQVTRKGPAFQVGLGASGKNLNYGASGWLNLDRLAQPTNGLNLPAYIGGDANVDLSSGCP